MISKNILSLKIIKVTLVSAFIFINLFSSFSIAKTETSLSSNQKLSNKPYYKYSILAMVNDVPITPMDVEKRIKFLRVMNNIPNNISVSEDDKKRILQGLIDDIIKQQETNRFKVEARPDQIEDALSRLARNQGVSVKTFKKKFNDLGISDTYIEKSLGRQLAWDDLIKGRFARDITISTYEISQVIQATAETNGVKIKYNKISLSFDGSLKDKQKVQKELDNISKKLSKGEEFRQIAHKYENNALEKTEILGEMRPEFIQIFSTLEVGAISQPTNIEGEIVILQLVEKEQGDQKIIRRRMDIKTGFLPLDSSDIKTRQREFEKIQNQSDICENFDDIFNDINEYNAVLSSELPKMVQEVANVMSEGETKILLEKPAGYDVITLCKVKPVDYYSDVDEKIRSQIRNKILTHKLSLKEKKYFRDLSKTAVINIYQ